MSWTVNRRIAAAFAVVLGLTLLLVLLGGISMRSVEASFRTALNRELNIVQPALTAESATREATVEFHRFLHTADERFEVTRDSAVEASRSLLTQLRDNAETAEGLAQWELILDLLNEWDRQSVAAMDAVRAGNPAQGQALWESVVYPLRVQLHDEITGHLQRIHAVSAAAQAEASAAANRMRQILLFGGALTVLIGAGAALLLTRAVSGPLQETTSVLASSAAEILAATTQQASSAAETSAAVIQTSATVDEVTQTARQSTDRARAVAEAAQRAAEIGQKGRRTVESSIAAMGSVKEEVESIAHSIVTLAEQAQAIGEIIATVNDLAEQTNLLALNAAVEAARAGEHGRGFSVVAGEVRNLADQSKKATVQVRQILGEIQRATSAAVMTTERGTRQVEAGAAQIQEAGETIRTLAEAANEAAQAVAQIVASAGQQAAGMSQIRQAIENIQEATQQTLASTRQSEQAATDLHRLGDRLLDIVGRNGGPGSTRHVRA